MPLFQVIPIHDAKPSEFYAPIESPQGSWSIPAAVVVGGVAGALLGAGFVASRKFSTARADQSVPGAGRPLDDAAPGSESDTDPEKKQ